jgi:hypothetical protein
MKMIWNKMNNPSCLLAFGAAVLVAGSTLAVDHASGTKSQSASVANVEVDETPLQH